MNKAFCSGHYQWCIMHVTQLCKYIQQVYEWMYEIWKRQQQKKGLSDITY